ncbi:hypothetical protein ACIPW5_30875 [Streptomyces sp. NPDC090077]|uniref:hypothetical protein n=1 Tax=Streptomyces sp. NPDC090077 TaxID=3365938 RepID=UPI0037F7900E
MNTIGRPPAPRRRRAAPRTVTAVLVIGTGALLGRLGMNALAADGPGDARWYDLVPPASFQGLTLQESGPRVDAVREDPGLREPGTEPVAAVYADQEGTARLVVSGVAGAFADRDPGAELAKAVRAMGVDGAVAQRPGTPAGGAMSCGTRAAGVLCVWADHSSLVTVTVPVGSGPVTIGALAERTRALRTAMEVPAWS